MAEIAIAIHAASIIMMVFLNLPDVVKCVLAMVGIQLLAALLIWEMIVGIAI